MEVRLTWPEVFAATQVGMMRTLASLKNQRHDMAGYVKNDAYWDADIQAAAAECAVAKALGKYWPASVNTFKGKPDIPPDIEVRQTHHANGRLLIRERDDPGYKYVLVTGRIPTFEIRGFILGNDGKNHLFQDAPNDRAPAYFVPQDKLNELDAING